MSDLIKPPAETNPDAPEAPTPEVFRAPDGSRLYTEAEAEARAKDKLDRQRRAMEAQQREKEQALETQKLEEQKEFEKLAKQRLEEVNTLKPRAGLAEGYEKRVAQLMSEAAKTLPGNIQTLLNKLSLPDQLDWLTENLESVRTPPTVSASTNVNAWDRTSGVPSTLTDEDYRAKKRREMNF